MSGRTKFLILSNPRTGSTWLETTLGALPDTTTDYEFKWDVAYTPGPVHYVLDEHSPSVVDILDELDRNARVVGGKFVFDPVALGSDDWQRLKSKLRPPLRIVHLIRRYRDMFLSMRRGFVHQMNAKAPWKIGAHLKSVFHPIADEVVGPVSISPAACLSELTVYLQNDLYAFSLRDTGAPYLRINYSEIGVRIAQIANFVGSTATDDTLSTILDCPITSKLSECQANSIIQNLDQLEPIFEQFELIREYLFLRG